LTTFKATPCIVSSLGYKFNILTDLLDGILLINNYTTQTPFIQYDSTNKAKRKRSVFHIYTALMIVYLSNPHFFIGAIQHVYINRRRLFQAAVIGF